MQQTVHADTIQASASYQSKQQRFMVDITDHSQKLTLKAMYSLPYAKSWDVAIDSQQLNLNFLDPYLDTAIDSTLNIHYQANDMTIHIDHLQGQVNQQPCTAQGKLQVQPKQHIATGQLQLAIGHNTFNIHAKDKQNIAWLVTAPVLSQLHPELSGQLNSTGSMTWQQGQWLGQMTLQATSLQWQQHNLADKLTVSITPEQQQNRIELEHHLNQQPPHANQHRTVPQSISTLAQYSKHNGHLMQRIIGNSNSLPIGISTMIFMASKRSA